MTKIYVGNLPFTATEQDVKELFGQHGVARDVEPIAVRVGRCGLAALAYQ
mgnify:CR=1 FL=1